MIFINPDSNKVKLSKLNLIFKNVRDLRENDFHFIFN